MSEKQEYFGYPYYLSGILLYTYCFSLLSLYYPLALMDVLLLGGFFGLLFPLWCDLTIFFRKKKEMETEGEK